MPRSVDGQKLCSTCGITRAAGGEFFAPAKNSADGLRSRCRECDRAADKRTYDADPDRARAMRREHARKNPERAREIARKSWALHRDKRVAELRERYRADPAPHRQRVKEYRLKNLKQVTETVKNWRLALRAEMLSAYGGRCTCCGEDEPRFLTLEHVGQTGATHRKALKGQVQVYCELRRLGWPTDGFTLLCWNCNMATARGELCPHEICRRQLVCEAA